MKVPEDGEQAPAYEVAPQYPTKPPAGNTAYPPQAHHAQAPSHTLNVEYEGWKGTRARIMSTDNSTRLFDIKLSYFSKPSMVITACSPSATRSNSKEETPEPIGTVTFHNLSSRIDTSVHSAPLTLTLRSKLKLGYKFTSRALGDLEWRTQSHKMDLACLDSEGVARARFVFANWSLRRCGTFEMLGQGSELARDELLVTGLAFVYYITQFVIAVS